MNGVSQEARINSSHTRLNDDDTPYPPLADTRHRALIIAIAKLLLRDLERRPQMEDEHGQDVESHANGAADSARHDQS